MAAKDYLDPKGYWADSSGNIRRMSGQQEIIAAVTSECSEAEWKTLSGIAKPKTLEQIATELGAHRDKRMNSILSDGQIDYGLEKIGDFIRGSGSGAIADWSDEGSKVVIDKLHAIEEKLLASNFTLEPCELHVRIARYAIDQLQRFITGDKSDIPHKDAAEVFREALSAQIRELRKLEEQLDNNSSEQA